MKGKNAHCLQEGLFVFLCLSDGDHQPRRVGKTRSVTGWRRRDPGLEADGEGQRMIIIIAEEIPSYGISMSH